MSTQITVRLPDDLREALEQASRRTGLKSSHVVREALRHHLIPEDRSMPRAARVQHLLGSLETGIPDLAERHRDYVIASLTRDG
jgi:predicted transcriptional regulator